MKQVVAEKKQITAWCPVPVSMMAIPAQTCVSRNMHSLCSYDMLAPAHAQHSVSALTRPPARTLGPHA